MKEAPQPPEAKHGRLCAAFWQQLTDGKEWISPAMHDSKGVCRLLQGPLATLDRWQGLHAQPKPRLAVAVKAGGKGSQVQ